MTENQLKKNKYFYPVFTLLLLAFFFSGLLRQDPSLRKPLLNLAIEEETDRRAVIHSSLPSLPVFLTADVTAGEYLLENESVIPSGYSVTIAPQTKIFAARDATIVIKGKLVANNTEWHSNQIHPSRRYWHGITVEDGGELTANVINVTDATAALTVSSGGKVDIAGIISDNLAGVIVMKDGLARIANSIIKNGAIGMEVFESAPQIENVKFENLKDGIRVFNGGKPALSGLDFKLIQNKPVDYRSKAD